MAEGLLDHHPPPRRLRIFRIGLAEFGLAETFDDGGEEAVRHRQVEQDVAARLVARLELAELRFHGLERLGILEVALEVEHPGFQPVPTLLVDLRRVKLAGPADEALHHLGQAVAPALISSVGVVDPDDGEVVRQKARGRKIVERRRHQPLRQVASAAEDHHGAGPSLWRGGIGGAG